MNAQYNRKGISFNPAGQIVGGFKPLIGLIEHLDNDR
jgi:hypothetical protein